MKKILLILVLCSLLASCSSVDYTIVFKDGSTVECDEVNIEHEYAEFTVCIRGGYKEYYRTETIDKVISHGNG